MLPLYSLCTEQLIAMDATLMLKLQKKNLRDIGQKEIFDYVENYQKLINYINFYWFSIEKTEWEIGFPCLPASSIKGRLRSKLEQLTNSKEKNIDTKIIIHATTGNGKTYSAYLSCIDYMKKLHMIFDDIRYLNERSGLTDYFNSVLISRMGNINLAWSLSSYIFNKHLKNRACSNLEQLTNSKETNEYAEIISLTTEAGENYLPSDYIEKNIVIYGGGDDYCVVGNFLNLMKNIKIKKQYINHILKNEIYIPFLFLKSVPRSLIKKSLDLIQINAYREKSINNSILMRNVFTFYPKENCFKLIFLCAKLAFMNKGRIQIFNLLICNVFAKYSFFSKKEAIFTKDKTKDNTFFENTLIYFLNQVNNLDRKIFRCINLKFCLEKIWLKLIKLQYSCFYFAKIYIESLDKKLKIKIKVFHELQITWIKHILIPSQPHC